MLLIRNYLLTQPTQQEQQQQQQQQLLPSPFSELGRAPGGLHRAHSQSAPQTPLPSAPQTPIKQQPGLLAPRGSLTPLSSNNPNMVSALASSRSGQLPDDAAVGSGNLRTKQQQQQQQQRSLGSPSSPTPAPGPPRSNTPGLAQAAAEQGVDPALLMSLLHTRKLMNILGSAQAQASLQVGARWGVGGGAWRTVG